MNKILFITALLLCAGQSIAQQPEQDNSILIKNFSDLPQQVWVNAVSYKVAFNASLRVPCNAGESIEIQLKDSLEAADCGTVKELY